MRDIISCFRRLFGLAWHLDRRRFVIGSSLLVLGAVATPVVAVAVGKLVDGLVEDGAFGWAFVVAAALVCELMLGHFAHLYYFELSELIEDRYNQDLIALVNGTTYLDRADDPRHADRVDLLRQDVMQMRVTVQSGLQLGATVIQLVFTAVVLTTVSAWLLALTAAAVVPVVLGKRAEAGIQAAREAEAPTTRKVRHLRGLAANPASQKEIRLSGASGFLIGRQAALLDHYSRVMRAADRRHAWLRCAGQLGFAVAYVAALVWTFELARQGLVSVGEVVLTVILATQLSIQMATGVELLGAVHRAAAGLRRFAEFDDETRRDHRPDATTPLPATAAGGLRLEAVSFRYPGADRDALSGIDLDLAPGSSVALVGENGAGKSTLLKVLCGLYRPTDGRVLAGGTDLADVDPAAWRKRTAALFQDFAQIELSFQHSVGIGRLADVDRPEAVFAAAARAGADHIATEVGLDGILGNGYSDGRSLSGGQWQRVGFARTLMREDPLLLVLDEPAAALDALAEQELVDAYQDVSQKVATTVGGVTIFVTHRMSTVRLADHIVVLADGGIAEHGDHEALLARGGRYADLWELQARNYAD